MVATSLENLENLEKSGNFFLVRENLETWKSQGIFFGQVKPGKPGNLEKSGNFFWSGKTWKTWKSQRIFFFFFEIPIFFLLEFFSNKWVI